MMSESDRKQAYYVGSILLNTVKWIVLIFSVIYIGLSVGLIVATIVYGADIEVSTLVKFTSVLLPYKELDVTLFVTNYGMSKVLTASLGYVVGASLNNIIIYILISKIIQFYKNATIGELYNKKTYDLTGELIKYSFILTFLMPIILFIISTTTNLFIDAYMNVSFVGLAFISFACVVRIMVARGINLVRENNKYDRVIDDYKADIDELKIQSIKREAELKELKKVVEESNTTDSQPKKRKRHHSRAKKGTTTK